MFYEKVHDKGDNLVDNPNIHNVEGDNWLSPGLQPLTTASVVKIFFLFNPVPNFISYTRNYFLSSKKQNVQALNI